MKVLVLVAMGRTANELGMFCDRALRSLGHSTHTFLYDDCRVARRLPASFPWVAGIERRVARKRLFRAVSTFSPDLIFGVKVDALERETLGAMRARFGIPMANYWIDDPYYLDVSSRVSPHYDVFFTNARQCIEAHRRAGCRAPRFLSFGYDPSTHRPMDLTPADRARYRSDICFSGTVTPERLRVLEKLAHLDLKIWSPPEVTILGGGYRIHKRDVPLDSPAYARFTGESVWGERMVKAFAASKIVLNLHTQQTATMRDFEAPACGAFLLSDHVAELEEQFRVGEEIVCFRDADDAVRMAEQYLEDGARRMRVAAAGHAATWARYAYANRMEQMLADVMERTR
jgi:spore maturation protein CgeB